MEEFIKYVGLDVHGKTIAAAVADSRSSEVRFIRYDKAPINLLAKNNQVS